MTATAHQRLAPCVDTAGHSFAVDRPAAGSWGYALTYCTRCGATRTELLLPVTIAGAVTKALATTRADGHLAASATKTAHRGDSSRA